MRLQLCHGRDISLLRPRLPGPGELEVTPPSQSLNSDFPVNASGSHHPLPIVRRGATPVVKLDRRWLPGTLLTNDNLDVTARYILPESATAIAMPLGLMIFGKSGLI
jgi:hypothetical protein